MDALVREVAAALDLWRNDFSGDIDEEVGEDTEDEIEDKTMRPLEQNRKISNGHIGSVKWGGVQEGLQLLR